MAALVALGPARALDAATLEDKQRRLMENLRSLGHVMVAYSGGTDSAYLAWAAKEALGDRAVALRCQHG